MTEQEQTSVFTRAIETYGEEAQVRQLMEEASELAQAANKDFNAGDWRATAEEYADVVIMLEQFLMIAGVDPDEWNDEVARVLEYKTERLAERLETASCAPGTRV